MKLYKYTFGEWENYGPAVDDADAYERRVGIDPQFHYVPVTIEEVKLEGYTIEVVPEAVVMSPDHINDMDRDSLKQYLKNNEIEFVPQWGEEKLREIALQHT